MKKILAAVLALTLIFALAAAASASPPCAMAKIFMPSSSVSGNPFAFATLRINARVDAISSQVLSGLMCCNPASPAQKAAPWMTLPSKIAQQPIPVPTVIQNRDFAPCPEPSQYSPSAAAFTSFSTVQGRPQRFSKHSCNDVPG